MESNTYKENVHYPKSEFANICKWRQDHKDYNIDEYSDHLEISKRASTLIASGRIKELKQKLFASDYQAIKYSEGFISEEEYAPIKAERQKWRDEINALEEELKES